MFGSKENIGENDFHKIIFIVLFGILEKTCEK